MSAISEHRNGILVFLHRYLSRIVDVEPYEIAAMLSGFAYFFCLLCGYYLLRPLRDVISIFWSAIADNFNTEQGQRLFGFIAAGGTTGALAGPMLAASLVTAFGVAALAVIGAILLELAFTSNKGELSRQRCPIRHRAPSCWRSLTL
jgi:ATP/ADP translocase